MQADAAVVELIYLQSFACSRSYWPQKKSTGSRCKVRMRCLYHRANLVYALMSDAQSDKVCAIWHDQCACMHGMTSVHACMYACMYTYGTDDQNKVDTYSSEPYPLCMMPCRFTNEQGQRLARSKC